MRHPRRSAPEHRTVVQHVLRCIVPVLILALGVGVYFLLIARGEEEEGDDQVVGVPTVKTEKVLLWPEGLDIEVDGIVTPFRDIEVAAEIGGRISSKTDVCRAGNFVTERTKLVEIDPADYDLELQRSRWQLEQTGKEIDELDVEEENVLALKGLAAEELRLNTNELARVSGSNVYSDSEVEKGDDEELKKFAARELARVSTSSVYSESEVDQTKRSVIVSLNALQALDNQLETLKAKKKRLEVARSVAKVQLDKADLDMTRTTIKAPVTGVIVRDSVEAGSYVQKGTPLFVIEDTSRVEVRCNLQMEDLYWLWQQDAPSAVSNDVQESAYQIPPTPATVIYQIAGHGHLEYHWQGELRRYDGMGVDERTRTVPCRIVVDNREDVQAVKSDSDDEVVEAIGPPVLVRGMYVTVLVKARLEGKFVKIPDTAIEPGKRTWRVKDDKLDLIESLPLVKYIEEPDEDDQPQGYWLVPWAESGIAPGDRVVVRPVAGMRDGMEVEEGAESDPESEESSL